MHADECLMNSLRVFDANEFVAQSASTTTRLRDGHHVRLYISKLLEIDKKWRRYQRHVYVMTRFRSIFLQANFDRFDDKRERKTKTMTRVKRKERKRRKKNKQKNDN